MIYLVYDNRHDIYARKLKESLSKLRYPYKERNIPKSPKGLPFGQKIKTITYEPKSQWKPFLLKELARQEDVTYMDVDMLVKERFDEFFKPDVSITVHEPPKLDVGLFPHITAYVNAGLINIKNNKNGHEFVDEWCETMKETMSGSDQEALTIMYKKGVKDYVKTFPTHTYNNCEPENNKGKILHYVGVKKQILRDPRTRA